MPYRRLDAYNSYHKTLQNIKKVIIRNIFELSNKPNGMESVNPLLLNEFLWTLDFGVTLKVNENKILEITNINKTLSPFKNLMDIAKDYSNNLRVPFSIINLTPPRTLKPLMSSST